MKRTRRQRPPVRMPSGFTGFRFPPEVILLAVRWYLRYGLSYRDLEELLAERGIEVDHVTLYRWVQRFTPLMIDAARPCRHVAGDRWFVDETYVKVSGVWRYVYRAVDQDGQVIDVYVSRRRDIASARTFFTAALTVHGVPAEVVTDRAPALENVIDELVPAAGTVALFGIGPMPTRRLLLVSVQMAGLSSSNAAASRNFGAVSMASS